MGCRATKKSRDDMAFINRKNKIVQLKIVYYGPGRSGKTTNLEYIFKKYRQRIKSDIVSVSTHGDRTLFFDYMPFNLGKVSGYDMTIQLYTVPGQVKYESTRKLVLKGADGVVFVADSMEVRREKNRNSLKNLHDNLKSYNKSIFDIPLVLQYNKRDLSSQGVALMDVATMDKELNGRLKVPFFESSATTGDMVIPTLKKIISMSQAKISDELTPGPVC